MDILSLADLCTPWCLHAAATLRIAEHIAAGTDEIEALAQAAGCDRDALHAVLGRLVSKGVFAEPAPGRFALNDAARQLLDPQVQLSLDLEGIGGRFAHAWGTLLPYLRTGQPAYAQIFSRPFWDDLAAHPDMAASFDALIGPAGHGFPNPHFELQGGWEALKHVVDVGGGTGTMLAGLLNTHPHLTGTLVDQPGTVERAAEIFKAAGLSRRVQRVGQSFFDPLPTGADLYLLRGILNDFPDREALAILQRCAEAIRASGSRPGRVHSRVVVLKSIIPDDAPRSLTIEMVLLGGKQRGLSAFRQLAAQAGLHVTAAGPSGGYFVVECSPE